MSGVPSIRGRLSRVLVWASLAWGLGVAAVVWFTVHHEVEDLLDQALRESAEVLYGTIGSHLSIIPLGGATPMPAPVHEEHLVWQIVDDSGRMLARSHQAPTQPLGEASRLGLWSAGLQWRVAGMRFSEQAATLFVAQRMSERVEARTEAAAITALLAFTVGLICAAWLSLRTQRELQPLAELSEAVTRYDPLNAAKPLAPASRAELLPMCDAIEDLAQRLAHHLANERSVAAHAAHALRTPLAGLVAQLATAQKLAPPEVQPPLQRARGAADRLRHVVGALITLFRSGAELRWQAVDLPMLLSHLPAAGLKVTLQGEVTVQADADLLAAVLANLIDNAVRHDASELLIQVEVSDVQTRLRVQDNGSGCSPEREAELRQALAGQRYESGIGLGLMLADLVARAHGGAVEVIPSTTIGPGAQGFALDLRLGRPPLPADPGELPLA